MVVYNEKYVLDYDATQIDPEWHGWIHYTTDELPTVQKPITYKWVDQKPLENKTGLIHLIATKFNINLKLIVFNL